MDNDFQDQVEEDLNINSHEPATKGDLRNLALRVELRIVKAESKLTEQIMALNDRLNNRITEMGEVLGNRMTEMGEVLGNRITKIGEVLGNRITEADGRISSTNERVTTLNDRISTTNERISSLETSLKEHMYTTGWKFFAATVGTMGVMFTVFAMLLPSQLK